MAGNNKETLKPQPLKPKGVAAICNHPTGRIMESKTQ